MAKSINGYAVYVIYESDLCTEVKVGYCREPFPPETGTGYTWCYNGTEDTSTVQIKTSLLARIRTEEITEE